MKIYKLAFLLLFQFPVACNETSEFLVSSPITDSQQKLNRNKSGVVNIVFKSTDGGQTWQDISEELPENLQEDGFLANDSGLYLLNRIFRINRQSQFYDWVIRTRFVPSLQRKAYPICA